MSSLETSLEITKNQNEARLQFSFSQAVSAENAERVLWSQNTHFLFKKYIYILQFTNRSSEKDIEGELKQKRFRENWRGHTEFTKKNILVLKTINLPQ